MLPQVRKLFKDDAIDEVIKFYTEIVNEVQGIRNACTYLGSGSQINTRNVSQPQLLGGLPCPTLEIVSDCNLLSCPVDCFVSEWGEFGMCDRMCGGGQMQRKRTV